MTVKALRGLLKDMQLRQSGKKEVLIARILISADIQVAEGESLTNLVAFHRVTSRFSSWREHQISLDEKVPQYWIVAPRVSHSLSPLESSEAESFRKKKNNVIRSRQGPDVVIGNGKISDADGDAQRANVTAAAQPTCFSISEFARLYIIIRDDEDANAALLATGQELTRSQMDAGFSRDSFWGVIESRYNDPDLKIYLNMVGNVDDIDSAVTPPVQRSARFLKEKIFDARTSFTKCIQNWSTSGQNDNYNFIKFAGTREGELTAAVKRNMVLFVCAILGTENADSRFSRICSRVIPFGLGVDEGESIRVEDRVPYGRTERAPTRREFRGNSKGDNEPADHSFAQLSKYLIHRGRENGQEGRKMRQEKLEESSERRQQRREKHDEFQEAAADRQEKKRRTHEQSEGLQQLEKNHKLIKLLRYASETLESHGQDPGAELVIAVRRQKKAVLEALQMPQNTPEGWQGDITFSEKEGGEIPCNRQNFPAASYGGDVSCDTSSSLSPSEEEDRILPNN